MANDANTAEPDLLLPDVAAYRLGISLAKLRSLVRAGHLRAVTLGYRTVRIDRRSLEKLIGK